MKDMTPASVMGADCKALAAELLSQPDLLRGVFDDDKTDYLPDDVVRMNAVKRYTGARSTTDESRLLFVGALRLLGASDREIERAAHVTRRSIPLLIEELERTGRVTPLKDRLTKLVGDNAERSALALRLLLDRAVDGHETIELAAMIKSVGSVNTYQVEKYQLLTGQATEIVEQRMGAGRAEIEEWLRQNALPVESESTVTCEKTSKTTQLEPVNTSVDTVCDKPRAQHGPATSPAASGGGGDAARPPVVTP